MTDDLVKKLRERADLRMMTASLPPQPVKDWLCQEAADRIEQLEAALEEARVIAKTGWLNCRDADYAAELCEYIADQIAALGKKKDD